MMIRLLALMAVLTLGACATTPPSGPPPPTILISIDGFRPTTWIGAPLPPALALDLIVAICIKYYGNL